MAEWLSGWKYPCNRSHVVKNELGLNSGKDIFPGEEDTTSKLAIEGWVRTLNFASY